MRISKFELEKILDFVSTLLLLLFGVAVALLLNMGLQQMTGNFHEVLAGEFYRSAQPDAEDIADYRTRFGINTIISLRDEAKSAWYPIEEEAARDNGIAFIHFPISSASRTSLEDMQRLASVMANVKKPILIHCEHGSNRTGLASAIYLAGKRQTPQIYADLQMSPFYGHVPIPGIGRYNLFRSWLEFRKALVHTTQ
jgi:protein tyrosine/serine phosphatase